MHGQQNVKKERIKPCLLTLFVVHPNMDCPVIERKLPRQKPANNHLSHGAHEPFDA